MAVHEAGHAVARIRLDAGMIETITTDLQHPRGCGVTWIPYTDDEMTEQRLTAELVILMAGRAAEEVLLGSISAYAGGADYSDLAQANDLAVQMETVLGLGSSMPLLHLPTTDRTMLLTANPDLAARIHQRLQNAYEEARGLIARHREAVSCMADAILCDRPLKGAKLKKAVDQVRAKLAP